MPSFRSSSKGDEGEGAQEKKAKLVPAAGHEREGELRESAVEVGEKEKGGNGNKRSMSESGHTENTNQRSSALSGLAAYSSESSDSED